VLPLARSTAQVKLAINLRMSQAAGTPGRPWQDGPTAPRIATPASTQMIPAIGLKKDIAAAFNLRHHACIKASTSVKVRSARKIGLATLVPLSKNVIPPATLLRCLDCILPSRHYVPPLIVPIVSLTPSDVPNQSCSQDVTLCRYLPFLSHGSKSLESCLIPLRSV